MLSRVTDLAVEVRESFPDDNVEISGVQIEKTDTGILGITMTVVDIKDEHGAEAMGKPVGEYITLEFSDSGWRKSDIKKDTWKQKNKSFDSRSWKQICDTRYARKQGHRVYRYNSGKNLCHCTGSFGSDRNGDM